MKEFWIVRLWCTLGNGEYWDSGFYATLPAAYLGLEKTIAIRRTVFSEVDDELGHMEFRTHHFVLDGTEFKEVDYIEPIEEQNDRH